MSNTQAENPTEQIEWRELVAVVLLSMTAVLTAWSGFQASKWGGEMAIWIFVVTIAFLIGFPKIV
jgi:uncharacterized membrane protein YkgB